MAVKTLRLETRLTPEERTRIERGARLASESVSSFMVTAAIERADSIASELATTRVEAEYFDLLLESLDRPDAAPSLNRAARRVRAKPRISVARGASS